MDLLEKIEGAALIITAIMGMALSIISTAQLISDEKSEPVLILIFVAMFILCAALLFQAIKEIKQMRG